MAGNVECEFKQYLIFEPGVQVTFSVLYTLIAGAGIAGRKTVKAVPSGVIIAI